MPLETGKIFEPTFSPVIIFVYFFSACEVESSQYQLCSFLLKTIWNLWKFPNINLQAFAVKILSYLLFEHWLNNCYRNLIHNFSRVQWTMSFFSTSSLHLLCTFCCILPLHIKTACSFTLLLIDSRRIGKLSIYAVQHTEPLSTGPLELGFLNGRFKLTSILLVF